MPDFPTRAGNTATQDVTRGRSNVDQIRITVGPTEPAPPSVRKHKTGKDREDEHNAPADRVHWFVEPRAYPGKEIAQASVLNGYLQSVQLEQMRPLTSALADMPSLTQWQLLGPGNFAGRATAIAVDPANTQRIYACTSSGGAWRSADGGAHWTDIGQTLGSNFVSAVTVDPHNSNIVYVCTGDHDIWMTGVGLFKSVNMGNTFTLTGLHNIAWACRVIVHPTNSNVVYVGSNLGVHKSSDGGITWSILVNGVINDLVMNPAGPTTMYAGVNGTGVYKTIDGGTTWTLLSGKPNVGFGRARVALCTGQPNNLYASFDVNGTVQIFKTTDSGATWAMLPAPPDAGWGQLWYNHYIAVKPDNPNVVYSGQGTIFRSLNGGAGGVGKAWLEISAAIGASYTSIHVDHHCLTFDPGNPSTIYCGCDGGVYRSKFGGNYWEYIGASIPCSEFYSIGQGVQEGYEVGGGTQDNGTWLTDGNYDRWQFILGGDGFQFVVDPTNPNTMYAEWQGLNLNRSDNKGVNFAYKSGGIMEADPKPWMGEIELDQSSPSTLFVGSDRVYKTVNRMDNWTLLSCGDNLVLISNLKGAMSLIRIEAGSTASAVLGLSGQAAGTNDANNNPQTYARMVSSRRAPYALTNGMTLKVTVDAHPTVTVTFNTGSFVNIGAATAREVAAVIQAALPFAHAGVSAVNDFTAIRVAPSNSSVVYAAAVEQIWRSADGGGHWTSIMKAPLPNRWITQIDVVATNPNQLWVSVSGFGTPHIYYSADGGNTWTPKSNGLPDQPVSSVLVDPATPSRLWAATDDGVYTSGDSGTSWVKYSTGLPRVVATDLKLNKNLGLLRVGTYGRGIWEINATDVSIQITRARTASNGVGDKDTFRLTQDALALTLDIAASPELVNIGQHFDALFEIVNSQTNKVVASVWFNNGAFQWGQFFWISEGNNWGPAPSDYSTPQKWGLTPGIYYFRGTILVQNANAYAVSPRRWFRVVP
jgi:photosystem II stability/assembly factor-like uncharacterized protein